MRVLTSLGSNLSGGNGGEGEKHSPFLMLLKRLGTRFKCDFLVS